MTVFYQQSGKRGEQDFVKTLAERDSGSLRFFTASTLKADYGFDAKGLAADGGFQIWGVPTGAKNIVRRMQAGDLVLLIGHRSPKGLEYGKFFYAGRVTYVLPYEDFAFSSRLWGDGGFPLLFFVQGPQGTSTSSPPTISPARQCELRLSGLPTPLIGTKRRSPPD